MYRVHEIKIRKEDYAEANAILLKHELLGDIDEMDWEEYNAKTMEGTNEAYQRGRSTVGNRCGRP